MEIRNPYFYLNLNVDWFQEETTDEEQFLFRSKSKNAYLTVSCQPMNAKGYDLKKISNKLLETRFEAERNLPDGREVALAEPWGTEMPDGTLQVNYFGRDSHGRYFFYTGFITETHTTNITGELLDGNQPELEEFYKFILSNFGF